MTSYSIGVTGPAATKKTSGRIIPIPIKKGGVRTGKTRHIILPSEAWTDWVKTARVTIGGEILVKDGKRVVLLLAQDGPPDVRPWTPLAMPLNCRATFYLSPRQHGDLIGYLQGLGDLLETRGVIANDRLLVGFDGTRAVHDGSEPRVAVTLEPVGVLV